MFEKPQAMPLQQASVSVGESRSLEPCTGRREGGREGERNFRRKGEREWREGGKERTDTLPVLEGGGTGKGPARATGTLILDLNNEGRMEGEKRGK